MITNIDIVKLQPHPDNPRKDLGDLSELAASIKEDLTSILDRNGFLKTELERCLLVAVYCDLEQATCYEGGYYYPYNCTHQGNEELDLTYAFICKLGYEMSDEEKQLQDGTHELFMKEEVA